MWHTSAEHSYDCSIEKVASHCIGKGKLKYLLFAYSFPSFQLIEFVLEYLASFARYRITLKSQTGQRYVFPNVIDGVPEVSPISMETWKRVVKVVERNPNQSPAADDAQAPSSGMTNNKKLDLSLKQTKQGTAVVKIQRLAIMPQRK